MNNRKFAIVFAILPAMIYFLAQNAAYLIGVQVNILPVLWGAEPMSIDELTTRILTEALSTELIITTTVISGVFCLVFFSIWYRKLLKQESLSGNASRKAVAIGGQNRRLLVIPGILLIGIGCQYAGGFIVELLVRFFPSWADIYVQTLESIGIDATGAQAVPLIMVIYTAVVAPVVEELAFRGLCIKYAGRLISFWGTVIFSAILFGITHGNMLQGIYTLIFGIILGFIFAKTGRVWITIVIHALFNGFSVLGSSLLFVSENPIINFIILSVSLIAVYVGIRFILRAYPEAE